MLILSKVDKGYFWGAKLTYSPPCCTTALYSSWKNSTGISNSLI